MAERKGRKKGKAGKAEKLVSSAPSGEGPPAEPEGAGRKEEEYLRRLEEERDSFRERLQRVSADFANYQKRVQREMEESRKHGTGPVILELLQILDDLERAVAAAEGKMAEDFLNGFRMIADRFSEVLAKHGVTPVEAVGRPFDPNLHDALMEVEDPQRPDLTVVEEFQRGYKLHDRLLRPARVKVARNRGDRAETPGDDGGTEACAPVEDEKDAGRPPSHSRGSGKGPAGREEV